MPLTGCHNRVKLNRVSELNVFKCSGKHVKKSTKGDFENIVAELVHQRAFYHSPGRKYFSFKNMKSSLLCGLNLQMLFNWVDEHKKFVIFNRYAR